MHDTDFDSCSACRFFGSAYPDDQDNVRLRGWGACLRPGQGEMPPAALLAELRAAALGPDRHALRTNAVGLYRSEPGDACEYFEERVSELQEVKES